MASMIRKYKLNMSLGHACSIGGSFGAESLPSTYNINFNEGYMDLENFVYREDGVLRPPLGVDNTGASPAGTGAIKMIMSARNKLIYVISGDGGLYHSTDEAVTFISDLWGGSGASPTMPNTVYSGTAYGANSYVFKSITQTDPTYIITGS